MAAGPLEQSFQIAAHALAGSSAGVLAMSLLYPLENIRCRLQVQKNTPDSEAGAETGRVHYRGPLDCFRQILAQEGVAGLYRGLRSALVGVAVSSSVYFFWYQLFKKFLVIQSATPGSPATLTPLRNVLVASLAGTVNVFFTIPFWVVNTRLVTNKDSKDRSSSTILGMARKIYAESGIRGFYRGLIPALILVSNPATQFLVYDQLSNILIRRNLSQGLKAHDIGALEHFVVGAIAKAIATFLTYPYQLLKSRFQAESKDSPLTTWALFCQIVREEGWTTLFSGMSAKLSQTVLNSSFMFVMYEKLVRMFLSSLRWSLRSSPTIHSEL